MGKKQSYKTQKKPENKGCTTSTPIGYKSRNMFWLYHARQQGGCERILQASEIPQGFVNSLGETAFYHGFFSLSLFLLINTSATEDERGTSASRYTMPIYNTVQQPRWQNSQERNTVNKNLALKYGHSTSQLKRWSRTLWRVSCVFLYCVFIPGFSFYYLPEIAFLRNYQWLLLVCTQVFLHVLILAGKDFAA